MSMHDKQHQGVALDDIEGSYDVIVCGAGTSGSVVAGRLAAEPGLKVLLVEAGGAGTEDLVADPNQWPMALGSALDWGFAGDPNPALNGRAIPYSMGKALGGGSAVNVSTWSRGHRSDWDSFAAAAGNPRWAYEAVLDLYRTRIENWAGEADSALRGEGGAVRVQPAQNPSDFAHALLAAARDVGLPRFPNANGAMMEAPRGSSLVDEIVVDGRRRSIFDSYVRRSPARSRLTIITGTTVKRIRFDGDRATAVELSQNGVDRLISARQEIMLSCGAIKTPQILMLSGIGDANHLRPHGIPVVCHLPGVGRNLHDHVAFGCVWEKTEAPMPAMPRSETACFWTTSDDRNAPDMYTYAIQGAHGSPEMLSGLDLPEAAWSLFVGVRPQSRGRVSLRNADVDTAPAIDTGYLSDPDDLKRLAAGLATARAIGNSRSLRAFTRREVAPGPLSGEALSRFFRDGLVTFWHQCGTAAMGRDENAVVDADLRVRGLRNLRIADASVLPHVTSGNTMAPCVVIGEQAAASVLAGF